MSLRRFTRACLALAVIGLAAGCSRQPEPLTPEAARAKGDALLKQMSQTLANTQAFSYKTDQAIERVRGSEKVTDRFTRTTTIKRPNQLTLVETGGHDGAAWYDGKQLTMVSNKDKVWVRGPMPGTLDEALDYVSAEYAVQIPTADLVYSSPYDALMTPDTTGGWVNVEKVGEQSCDHLAYKQAAVDWEIWLSQDDRKLPRQFLITYKNEPGAPTARIAFSEWNPSPAITDATFTPTVPEGYKRIKIMRHATVVDENAGKEQGGTHD
jgi:hypothetical protein